VHLQCTKKSNGVTRVTHQKKNTVLAFARTVQRCQRRTALELLSWAFPDGGNPKVPSPFTLLEKAHNRLGGFAIVGAAQRIAEA